MRTTRTIGLDVSSFEHWQCTLSGNRASSLIHVRYDHSECALAKSRTHKHRRSIATLDGCNSGGTRVERCIFICAQPLCNRSPQCLARGRVLAAVAFTLNDVEAEIGRNRNPICLAEEEWLCEQNAADRRVF